MSVDGGPAFPCEVGPVSDGYTFQTGNTQWQQPGMTVRDYFAAKALECVIGLISDNDKAAQEAYKIADAMIRARE